MVRPVKALKRLARVQLVPNGGGQALISLEQPHSIPQLELDLLDAMQRADVSDPQRPTLEAIAEILREARRSPGIEVKKRTIIVLASKRRRRASAGH